jgi:hypothetical protein
MTTNVTITTNGNYVSSIKINGADAGTVGPGSNVSKTWGLPHNDGGPSIFEVFERPATADEIEAAKPVDA